MKASAIPAFEHNKRFGTGAGPDQQETLAIPHRLAVPAAAVRVLED